MKQEWSDASHVGKVTINILDTLSGYFHKLNKMEEPDYNLLIKLSQAAGYQAQIYSGLQKSHEFAKRLQRIEKELDVDTRSEETAMLNSPIITAEKDQDILNQGK